DAKLPLGVLDARIDLTGWHVHAFGEEFEVVDEVFHAGFHAFAAGWRHLVVVDDDRARVVAQPLHALADDAVAFTHFGNAHQIAVVAVAIDTNGNIEIEAIVHFVRLHAAQIPLNSGTAQHRAGKAQGLGTLGADNTYANQTLFPDPVVGQQRFVFIYAGWKTLGKVFDEVQQRARTRFVHGLEFLFAAILAGLAVLRHAVRQIAIDATGAVVGSMHARARYRLVAIHEVFP